MCTVSNSPGKELLAAVQHKCVVVSNIPNIFHSFLSLVLVPSRYIFDIQIKSLTAFWSLAGHKFFKIKFYPVINIENLFSTICVKYL